MIRRIGAPPEPDRKYTLRPGAYAILPRDGRVLLTCQSGPVPDVQLPGGGIDFGESPIQALHREIYEETGWRMTKPRRLGAFRRFVFMPEYNLWGEKICHVYVAHPTHRISDPVEPAHTANWMHPLEAIEMVGNDGDRLFLAHYFS